MEPKFGHDFRDVQIHTGLQAETSAEALGAAAYTVGRHIVFGAQQYRPATAAGLRLVAHELAHIRHQARRPDSVPAALSIVRPDTADEREADQAADVVMSGQMGRVRPRGKIAIQRHRSAELAGCPQARRIRRAVA